MLNLFDRWSGLWGGFACFFGLGIGLFVAAVVGGIAGGTGVAIAQNRRRVNEKREREKKAAKAAREREEAEQRRQRNRESAQNAIDNPINVTSRQPLSAQRLVFGETVTNGVLIYVNSNDANNYLFELYVVAAHEVEAINGVNLRGEFLPATEHPEGSGIYFPETLPFAVSSPINPDASGPERLTNPGRLEVEYLRYYLQYSIRLGTLDQPVDPIIARLGVPNTFRQRGHATIALEKFFGLILEKGQELENSSERQRMLNEERDACWDGLQPPLFRIRGAKFYDPRDATQDIDNEDTWKWTRNAALVIAGVMQHRLFGTGVSYHDFNQEALIVAANECDRKFTTFDGRSIAQYTLDGVVQTSEDQAAIISDMLNCCNGRLYHTGGKYIIDIASPRNIVGTIADSDLTDDTHVYTAELPDVEQFNVVQGRFQDINSIAQQTDAPILQIGDSDRGSRILNLNLRFVRDPYRAQRIMRYRLNRSRPNADRSYTGKSLIVNVDGAGLQYTPGDVVNRYSNGRYAHANGVYEIQEIDVNDRDGTISLSMFEFSNDNFHEGVVEPYDRITLTALKI